MSDDDKEQKRLRESVWTEPENITFESVDASLQRLGLPYVELAPDPSL